MTSSKNTKKVSNWWNMTWTFQLVFNKGNRSLGLKSIRDCKLIAPLLKNIWKKEKNVVGSSSTTKRRLIDAGLKGRISRRKPLLLPRHKQQHLQWAKDNRERTINMWKDIAWSNDSKFNLFHSKSWTYIRLRLSIKFNEDCIHKRFGLHLFMQKNVSSYKVHLI